MSGIKIIPVYGNKEKIIQSLQQNNLSEGITVIPPIQFILEGNTQFSCDKEKISQLNNDICFLKLSQGINNEEEKVLLNAIKTKKAPIEITSQEQKEKDITNDSMSQEESDLFESLEEDFEDENLGEVSIQDLNRLEDTTLKIANSKDKSIILTAQDRVISSMIPDNYKEAIFIYHTMVIDENGDIVFFLEKEPEVIFKAVKFTIDPENNTAFIDDNGGFIITSDARFTYAIENFAPAAVTVLTLDADKEYQIAQSWFIHHDQMDGCSSAITQEVLDNCKNIFTELYDEIEIGYTKPQDIIFDPLKTLGSTFNKEITQKIEEELIGEIYDDQEDTDNPDDD